MAHGPVRLHTTGASVHTVEMWWGERVLAALSNPTVAFLLLIFGLYGILFELYTPGWGVAGTLGVICLILGFFALAVLPVSYVGLVLIAVALGMFVAEAFVTSYGFLTLGGAVCLVLGGLMLVESPAGFQRVSLWVLVPVALATAAISFFLLGSLVQTHRARAQTGSEGLLGASATADADFTAEQGRFQAASKLRQAAQTIEGHPMAMQMRFLQTLAEVGTENNTTIVFPVPIELFSVFAQGAPTNGHLQPVEQ